ncbi:hypothetical protein ISN45_Aa07g030980 [Arabidopsis thaliana x Arabidopsis arenosa]|uniref:Reverse transcriptase domain-containing protein n=1 Tax=Arabidopsis thaliana x Arabidopsis arenosa TaxID=1240361 RepID=A0A8T1Y7N0_9BRAS|nr:hypothetical protein ISN45_Aa07g030980 [Arabidopsis thaliana x Arabidopsis arenosa]
MKSDGNFVCEEAKTRAEALRTLMSQNPHSTNNVTASLDDEFAQVFGLERPGRVRCVGRGPTPSKLVKHLTTSTAEIENSEMVVELKTQVKQLSDQVNGLTTFVQKIIGTSTADQARAWATSFTAAFANIPNPTFANTLNPTNANQGDLRLLPRSLAGHRPHAGHRESLLSPFSSFLVFMASSSPGESLSQKPQSLAPNESLISSSSASPSFAQVVAVQPSIPVASPSTAAPSYAERFKASLRNLRKIASPVLLEDGTPVVQAPASVLLKTADQWKGHIVAQFHGLIPPSGKIFSDLNPAWGKYGNIVVRTVSETSCLIMIPCVSTRNWVLQVGYWQAGNCAFSVYPWSSEASLQMLELSTAPTWAILKNVPPQMYSLDGISVITSAIGEPLHTEKSRLDPYNFGDTKVKVEITLDRAPPTTIIVRDSQQNSVKVEVSYPRLPPKCCNCGRFGHLLNRCPKPLRKKKFGEGEFEQFVPKGSVVADTNISLVEKVVEGSLEEGKREHAQQLIDQAPVSSPLINKKTQRRAGVRRRSKERSRSNPPVKEFVRHQRDNLMSEATQQRVKDWIQESKDRKLRESIEGRVVVSSSLEVSRPSNKDMDTEKVSGMEVVAPVVEQVSDNADVSKESNQWVYASKKMAKREEKKLFSKKQGKENADFVMQATFPGWRKSDNYELAENGRIWVVWDPSVSVIVFHKTAQLMVCGVLVPATGESFSAIFVYGYNTVIASSSEHFSILPHPLPLAGMAELNSCLENNELFDLPSRGAFFTWSNERKEDPVIRKLDRVVVNEQWSACFPDSLAIFDPPGDSDHSPSLKMKNIKIACRQLNREGFGNIQQRTKESLAHLEDIQASLLSSPSQRLFREEFVARQKWNFFAKAQEIFYRQKSRIRWMNEGDANTSFFHKSVIAHQGTNAIKVLRGLDDERVENSDQIKDMLVSYFQNLLGTESSGVTPLSVDDVREVISFRCLPDLASQLLQIPSRLEIQETISRMPKNKAPGPDGFPVEFLLESWEIIGEDIINAVQEFFITGYLPRKWNATAITLIPKVTGADKLTQFRPVSCCTTIYKIIARLLKNKLKLFISDAVQGNQVGFVQGRLLCENVLLASELVESFHCPGEISRGCLQVDLAKAYDNLSWEFLMNVLDAIDFPRQFVGWLKECVTTTSFSIAFNGELIGFFQGKKGLRQGDPISSLLFVLAMDVLSKKLDRGVINQSFGLHPKCHAPMVTHLSFADDILIFFDGREDSIQGILNILEDFKAASGLGINRDKTALFLDGGDVQVNQEISSRFGLQQGSFPVRYLGVPLTSKKLRAQDYQPLLDRIMSRFNAWTVKHLSYAGRLQLIKSVIFSIITFWASIFLLPNKCLEDIERMCNAFLWKGAPNSARGAKVCWDSVCSPKESGGLGLRRLVPWNKVLGLKLIWLIFAAGGSLWVSWVRRNLIGHRCFWDMEYTNSGSWIWKSLCKLRPLARPFLLCKVGSRISCRFWTDNWTGLGPLLDITGELGPRVTGLSRNVVVMDALRDGEWWISRSRSRNNIIRLLLDCLPNPNIVNSEEDVEDDCYLWKVGSSQASNVFSASLTWEHLNPAGPSVDWSKAIWFSGRIPKHAFIAWLAIRNRLHTRDRLVRWGLMIPTTCLLCNSHDESRQHLFFDCSYAAEVWTSFTSSAHLSPPSLFEDGVRWLKNPCRDKNIALILKLAFQASLYLIWKERNSRVHTNSSRPASALIQEINNIIRCRLDPLSRSQRNAQPGTSLFVTWFGVFQP